MISIKSRTARQWLNRLRYSFQNVKKDVFVDEHERQNVIEDRIKFLKAMADLKPYLVEFEDNDMIKPKLYPKDCQVGKNDCKPVICIIHDECTFSANNTKIKI